MSALLPPSGSTRRWRRLRLIVLDRDGWRCQLWVDLDGRHVEDGDPAGLSPDGSPRRCYAYADHVDHVVERQAGGSDHPSNLRASCRLGNLSRRPAGRASPAGVTRQNVERWSW